MLLGLAIVGLGLALALGYGWGRVSARDRRSPPSASSEGTTLPNASRPAPAASVGACPLREPDDRIVAERARLIRTYAQEAARAHRDGVGAHGVAEHAMRLAEERHGLFDELAQARAETARYRELVVAIEDRAPPPLLGGPGTPDDLKLIVGIGPVLERMLHQLGITSYRQIALWTERDIDAVEARLPEFPGRIRRDGWVVQARALHQSVYGELPRA